MKKMNSLKAAAIYMMVAFVGMVFSVSFASCGELDDDQKTSSVRFTVDPDTVERHDTVTKRDVIKIIEQYRDTIWGEQPHVIVEWDSLHNDTIKGHEQVEVYLNATANRKEAELEVTASQLATLRYAGKAISRKVDGRNHLISNSEISDNCGQIYTASTDAVKAALKKYSNIHLHVDTVVCSLKDSTRIQPKAGEVARYDWTTELVIKGHAVNTPSNKAWEIKFDLKDQRYIKAAKPDEPKLDSIGYKLIDKGVADGTHDWELQRIEYWNNDSTHVDTEKEQTIWSAVAVNPADRIVSTFDSWNFNSDNLKWNNNWTKNNERSNSTRTSMIETGYKRGYCSDGISADAYTTDAEVSHEKVTRIWGGHTWEIPADDVKLISGQNSFVERASDRSGYYMLVFTNIEKAVNGSFSKNLTESNKLYLKIAEPEIIDYILVDGSDYKIRTDNSVKVGLTIKPKYDNGTFGKEIPFKMERAESWTWKGDSVIYENVDFFMQETSSKLELVGNLKKTAKTQRDNGGVFSFNEYEGDFRTKVTSNGMTKYTTWHAVWSEDFTFNYTDENGNSFKHTFNKSDYSVKAQDDKLRKNESKSSATYEVYDYSVDGIFAIDNVTRSDYGYGRFTKAIEEKVTKIYWDETTKGQSHTVLASTRWATLIREYNTGKKTSQEYKHVFNRLSKTSSWEISAEEGSEKAANSLTIENASEESRTDGFAHFTLKKFELGQFFNVPGAAQQKDEVTFTESMGVYFEVKDQDGNPIKIFFEDPSYSFTNDVKDLVVVKEATEADPFTQFKHENVVNWNFGGATTTVSATGLINVEAQFGGGEPDFDIEVGSIYATISRPSNRNASDITAYTYLLVSKDGKKCVPFGIYHGVVTEGKITDWNNNVYGKGHAYNGACYVKDANEVVPTYSVAEGGFVKWYGDNSIVDAAKEITLQGAGFNDRGNDCINHTGKYAPRVEKQGNVVKVTFSDTNVSYTFKGWDVK